MTTYVQHNPVSPVEQHARYFLKYMRGEVQAFQQHITGIPAESERAHYTTLMLLRMMVLYFLQPKVLLAADSGYLASHLRYMQEQYGKDRFYRNFLLPLFQHHRSSSEANSLLNVPTIHLFARHRIEQAYEEIQIADEAFVRLFALFDTYNWQLIEKKEDDEHTLYPTVLSDFLEQQINQKQAGAYYTGKDVTRYICENSIVQHLLVEAALQHPDVFGSDGTAWHLLRENPDRYIRAALRNEEMLPLETPREYEARRARYRQLRTLLLTGGVRSSADMLTHNLAIMQFAVDALTHCQHPAALASFYENLTNITVLDPTCGTGALLIEAFNVLRVLYDACLASMRIECPNMQDTHHGAPLARIITHNLYGIDLIKEAADICAARLVLTALGHSQAEAERKTLSALECNIRCGNALVGRVNADSQTATDEFGASRDSSNAQGGDLVQAFHWNLHYCEVMRRGGFDVIIGNPPYIEYSRVRTHYQTASDVTSNCGNLYAAVIERALALSRPGSSHLGLIVPLSICGGERFAQLRATMTTRLGELWLANFEIFPARLFESAFQRLTIFLAARNDRPSCITHVTKIQRWYSPERAHLIALMHYTDIQSMFLMGAFPKLASRQQTMILCKIQQRAEGHTLGGKMQQRTETFVYYQEATNYWLKAVCRVPYYKKIGVLREPPHGRFLYLRDETTARIVMALMNSSLFYTWFATFSDGFHLAHALVRDFPLADDLAPLAALVTFAHRLEQEISRHARLSTRNTRANGETQPGHLIELEEYRMRYCKPLLDEIDGLLADYYGLTDAELDFIVNYDIKYRMGRE